MSPLGAESHDLDVPPPPARRASSRPGCLAALHGDGRPRPATDPPAVLTERSRRWGRGGAALFGDDIF